eukprot:215415-Chlamydomonas_euryale.AAC.1
MPTTSSQRRSNHRRADVSTCGSTNAAYSATAVSEPPDVVTFATVALNAEHSKGGVSGEAGASSDVVAAAATSLHTVALTPPSVRMTKNQMLQVALGGPGSGGNGEGGSSGGGAPGGGSGFGGGGGLGGSGGGLGGGLHTGVWLAEGWHGLEKDSTSPQAMPYSSKICCASISLRKRSYSRSVAGGRPYADVLATRGP